MGFFSSLFSSDKNKSSNNYKKKYDILRNKFFRLKFRNQELTKEKNTLAENYRNLYEQYQFLENELEEKEFELANSKESINKLRNEVRNISRWLSNIEKDLEMKEQMNNLINARNLLEVLGFSTNNEYEQDHSSRVGTISTVE